MNANQTIQHPVRWLGVTLLVAVVTILILAVIGAAAHSQSPAVQSCPAGYTWSAAYQYCTWNGP